MKKTIILLISFLTCALSQALSAQTVPDGYELVDAVIYRPVSAVDTTLAGKDTMRIIVCGHESQTTVTALFDNLGKGASGAAIQNMNIMLGLDETTGLSV